MRNAPDSDVQDYLYQKAEKSPNTIIELYTSSDSALRILFIDAREKNIIRKIDGVFMYESTILGMTDDAVIIYFKTPTNAKVLDSIKMETYPDFIQKIIPETVVEEKEPKTKTTKDSK